MINRDIMLYGDTDTPSAAPKPTRVSTEILIDPSLGNVKYGEKLRELLTELGMSRKELAAAIEMNERTVARYINGEFNAPIKPSVNERINLALNNAMHYKGYAHMDAVEYRKLFKKLWVEFSSEIVQTELVKRAGHLNQGNISDLLNNKYLIYSTVMQYDFLRVFYDLCHKKTHTSFCDRSSKLAIYSDHHDTADMLQRLLFGDAAVRNTHDDTDADADVVDNVIDYLMSLPDDAQELILSAPLAFFDSFTTPELNRSDKKFKSARDLIERFGQLSKDEQRSFYDGLQQLTEDDKVFRYWDDDKSWHLFEMNDQYRCMINSSRQRGIADPAGAALYDKGTEMLRDHSVDRFRSKQDDSTDTDDQSTDDEKTKKEKQKTKHRFEEALNTFDHSCRKNCPAETITDTIIDDIGFRLTMSPFEWHLWQLYISYIYTVQSADRIEALFHRSVTDQGFSDITEHIMSLSSKEQEIIYLNPMFFFDSAALNSTDRNGEGAFRYLSAYDFFSRYETLSDEEKQRLFQTAKDFRDMSGEWAGYPIGCDYYDNYKEIPAYGNPRLQREAIMRFLFDINAYLPDSAEEFKAFSGLIIRDISYKLDMTDEQWDVWCTVIEAVYNMTFGEPSKLSAEEIIGRLFEAAKGQR